MNPTLIGDTARLAALQADMEATPGLADELAAGDDTAIAAHYNAVATPQFVVYKVSVSVTEIGDKIDASELVGLTQLNVTRLQAVCGDLSGGTINPSIPDRRDAFDEIFSGAGGNVTRPRLQALWKRDASRVEKLFATGIGSAANPALMAVSGTLNISEVSAARSLP